MFIGVRLDNYITLPYTNVIYFHKLFVTTMIYLLLYERSYITRVTRAVACASISECSLYITEENVSREIVERNQGIKWCSSTAISAM